MESRRAMTTVSGRAPTLRAMTREVPLFPLGSVLFPGLVLPLHIFESRYVSLVKDLVADEGGAREFGVVAIRAGHEVGSGAARALREVGCMARLQTVTELPDTRFDISAVGTTRFRVLSVHGGDGEPPSADGTRAARRRRDLRTEPRRPDATPYLQATIEEIAEDDGEAPAVLAKAVGTEFARYRETLGVSPVGTDDLDARLLSYIVSSAMLLDQSDRQELLEAATTTDRLRLALRLLRREAVMLAELGAVPGTDAARMPPTLN